MSSPSAQQVIWYLARLGLAGQQSLRLRIALLRAEARERGRHARLGLALAVIGLVLACAAVMLALSALVMLLMAYGFSPPAALGLVAGGTAVTALILLVLGRSAIARALR